MSLKISLKFFFILFITALFSCNGNLNKEKTCREKFKKARDLTYSYPIPTRDSALDSALNLVNECLSCDSIRKAAVDLKITILIVQKKFLAGMNFIDSLKEGDFAFGYQKNMMRKNFQALIFGSKNDTISRNQVYAQIANDLEQYIKTRHVTGKEFDEVYTYLYALKTNYLNANQTNVEIDSLKRKYPDKEYFFDHFKR